MKNNIQKLRRKHRVRARIVGTKEKPRLSVFRSNNYLYAQLIDDSEGKTLLGMDEKKVIEGKNKKIDRAKQFGTIFAKQAREKKITSVVLDRGSYRYHGRIKSFADAAREGGLKF